MILVQKDLTKHSVLTKNLYIEVHTQLHPATTVSTFQNGTDARFSKIGKITHPPPKPKRKVPKYFLKFAQMTPTPSLQGTFQGTFR